MLLRHESRHFHDMEEDFRTQDEHAESFTEETSQNEGKLRIKDIIVDLTMDDDACYDRGALLGPKAF